MRLHGVWSSLFLSLLEKWFRVYDEYVKFGVSYFSVAENTFSHLFWSCRFWFLRQPIQHIPSALLTLYLSHHILFRYYYNTHSATFWIIIYTIRMGISLYWRYYSNECYATNFCVFVVFDCISENILVRIQPAVGYICSAWVCGCVLIVRSCMRAYALLYRRYSVFLSFILPSLILDFFSFFPNILSIPFSHLLTLNTLLLHLLNNLGCYCCCMCLFITCSTL